MIFASAGLAALLAAAPAQAQPYTIAGERAAHPNIARALDQMRAAMADLQAAPDNFGGHKGQAMIDLEHAIRSTKRALYYRLRMDDAALDALR